MSEERCTLCGEPIAEGDASRLPPMPGDTSMHLHARCFETLRAETRAKHEVWARSPRGRMILLGTWLGSLMTVVGVALLAIVAAAPITIYRVVRGLRLRRMVTRAIGAKSGLALVVYHAGMHPHHCRATFDRLRHFVFAFHDSTFDCIAEDFQVELRGGSLASALAELSARLGEAAS